MIVTKTHVLDIINRISAAKGKDKIFVIEAFEHSSELDLFKRVVSMAYKQGVAYHITSLPTLETTLPAFSLLGNKSQAPAATGNLAKALHLLDEANMYGRMDRADKQVLASVVSRLPEDDKRLVELIIGRDLKCGASLSSFRKVWGKKFCPDFPKMLCASFDEDKIAKNITFPAYSQLKSDGARAQAVHISTTSYADGLYTRNGQRYNGIDHIYNACVDLFGVEYIPDGELVVVDADGKILPRETGNGILNKCIKGTAKLHEQMRVRFIVWDLIFVNEWNGEADVKTDYAERWAMLERIMNEEGGFINGVNCPLILTENRIVNNLREAKLHYQEMLARGEEGTILKDLDGEWVDNRSTSQFKFKEEHEGDFIITSWGYGKVGSKNEKRIGKLFVATKCGKVTAAFGSLTDVQRNMDGDELIGTVIEGIYNSRTNMDTDEQSLFLPRPVELRFDKDKDDADTLESLIAREEASRQIGEL